MKEILDIRKSKVFGQLLGKGMFLSLLFVFFLYMGMNVIFPRKVIKFFKFQHFVISSTSMEPVLNVGDIIFIKPIDVETLEKDTIISFYHDVRLEGKKDVITHFFDHTEVVNEKVVYRTKRAGTTQVDNWRIPEEDLLGEYLFRIKGIGKVILFFNHPLGFRVFLIDIVIVYLIILLAKDIDEETNKK